MRRVRKAPKRAKQRLRKLTARTRGVSMERRFHAINRCTVSWTAYFAFADGEHHWTDFGLRGFTGPYRRFRDATRTAGCGPACPVVWEAPG